MTKNASATAFNDAIKLAEFYQAGYAARQRLEWQVTLAIWALAAVGIGYSFTHQFGYLAFSAYAIFIMHAMWLSMIMNAHRFDRERRNHWTRQAERLAVEPGQAVAFEPSAADSARRTHMADWSFRFQLVSTFALATMIVLLALFPVTKVAY